MTCRRAHHPLAVLLVVVALALAPVAPSAALPPLPAGRLPLAGSPGPVRAYAPPSQRWLAGHRGVDLAGRPDEDVLAAADGTVTYAGVLAGRGVVVIDHGGVRTTYEPVAASVVVGDRVRAGQPIGRLRAGHDCGAAQAAACLHWGLREGENYLDPMLLVTPGNDVRLLPGSAASEVARRASERAAAPPAADGPVGPVGPVRPGAHGAAMPAAGSITSPFGQRLHPVLHVWKLHDGTDFGTGCGAPLFAVHDGVVEAAYFNAGYGNRLLLDHGTIDGHRVKSAYNHAIRYTVAPGQRVTRGQVIGLSGTTGYSTGCHLHFMMWLDGTMIDPRTWLG